jgi:hypothetical protein
MVEYFGEQLSGFAFTANGWVQSYGSRCVKPPIIYGDVSRPKAMTVYWSQVAQSMTARPMKGMLTGPVTILNWSFVRNDQPRLVASLKNVLPPLLIMEWPFSEWHVSRCILVCLFTQFSPYLVCIETAKTSYIYKQREYVLLALPFRCSDVFVFCQVWDLIPDCSCNQEGGRGSWGWWYSGWHYYICFSFIIKRTHVEHEYI